MPVIIGFYLYFALERQNILSLHFLSMIWFENQIYSLKEEYFLQDMHIVVGESHVKILWKVPAVWK